MKVNGQCVPCVQQHDLKLYVWFGYNPQNNFVTFFTVNLNLVVFQAF